MGLEFINGDVKTGLVVYLGYFTGSWRTCIVYLVGDLPTKGDAFCFWGFVRLHISNQEICPSHHCEQRRRFEDSRFRSRNPTIPSHNQQPQIYDLGFLLATSTVLLIPLQELYKRHLSFSSISR